MYMYQRNYMNMNYELYNEILASGTILKVLLDQSQDIVTGNAHVSRYKSYNMDLISAYLPGNSDLHNSSRSNVIVLNEI